MFEWAMPVCYAPCPHNQSGCARECKLQAADKEATVRFTVDQSVRSTATGSMLAAKTGRKKVDIVRMLLEDGLKEVES